MSYIDQIFNIDNKVAIVTGASAGIGAAIARSFHEAGAQMICCARSAIPVDKSLIDFYSPCDITNGESFHDLCKEVYKKYGKIDVLVNAAGVSIPYKKESRGVDFSKTMSVNLLGAFKCINSVVDFMVNGGSIINITSIGGHIGFPRNPSYVASKSGLSGLTKAFAVDFGEKNIRVNNIVPGYIKTSMTVKSFRDPAQKQLRTNRTILQRWGETRDLIGAAIFLAGDSSSYLTGTDIIVDGGWLAKGL